MLLGYVRKSIVEEPGDTNSPARQRATILRWASQNGYQVRFFEDLDISGRREENRPGWQDLLTNLSDPAVVGVIVEAYDRSHRNVIEFLRFYDEQIAPRNLRLISATQRLDLSSSDGRAMASVMMAFAELEARKASDRMRAQISHKRRTQKKYHGRLPFGVDSMDGKLSPSGETYWVNPQTGEHQGGKPKQREGWQERRYYDALLAVYSTYAGHGERRPFAWVADVVNREGWRYRNIRGEPRLFSLREVRRIILQHRVYAGDLPVGRASFGYRAGVEYIRGAWEPVVPPGLCQKVADIERSRTYNIRSRRSPYLLTGLLSCRQCGKRLNGGISEHGVRRYRHGVGRKGCTQPDAVRADDIEAQVIGLLVSLVNVPENVMIISTRAEELISRRIEESADTSSYRELDRLQQRIIRLEDIYLDGEIDKAAYINRRAVMVKEIDRLRDLLGAPRVDARQVVSHAIDGLQHLERVSFALQKRLVQSMFNGIVIDEGVIAGITPTEEARIFFECAEGVINVRVF